jgi:hypothetical protein
VSTDSTSRPKDLPTRVFSNAWFSIGWIVFLAVVVTRFWRVRDALLVWWVYGRDAYFRDGVRVLPGKPVRFTTGALAPEWPDIATGAGFFFAVVFGLSILLITGLRVYERLHTPRNAA